MPDPTDSPRPVLYGRASERAWLERSLLRARDGHGEVLVLRGAPGIGKTALLDHTVDAAAGFLVVRVRGVESEMDLPYAALQVLCSPLLGGRGELAAAHRDALDVALGTRTGAVPDRFLLGLAVLGLLSVTARERPLLCVVDDAQWLDPLSARVFAFVARRLDAAPVAFLLAGTADFHGLPERTLTGLPVADSRALLAGVLPGRVDDSVVGRIIAESRGNPGVLLRSVDGVSIGELAGGFGVPATPRLPRHEETALRDRLDRLRHDSRLLLLTAAAEPTGDPALTWRAAGRLGIGADAAESLEADGLLSIGVRVTFRDPLLRAAVYAMADAERRRAVHAALADATTAADRRAWHVAHATTQPDEAVASELERHANTARQRSGFAALAAFLARSAQLTIDPLRRVDRALAAATAAHQAGATDLAVRMLATAERESPNPRHRAHLGWLRAWHSFLASRDRAAADAVAVAARHLLPFDPVLARQACLDALAAAGSVGRLTIGAEAVRLAREAWEPLVQHPSTATELLLDGLVVRATEGYAAAVEPLTLAVKRLLCDNDDDRPRLACLVAPDLWDDDTWHALSDRDVRLARNAGALAALPWALTQRALVDVHGGDFTAAAARITEANAITSVTGHPPFTDAAVLLAGWRGRATELVEDTRRDALERGEGRSLSMAWLAEAVLRNGLCHHDRAMAAARRAAEFDEPGLSGWALVELVEAAARCGEHDVATTALDRLAEHTRLIGTDWALGVTARARALTRRGAAAQDAHVEAIERLGRCRITTQLARARLCYGEWLRRDGRRVDARVPLREAHDAFVAMGADAFAERALRELLAAGERAHAKGTWRELTPQESRIASLARDGMTNPEIGTRLSVSPRTVEYHLRKVYGKLGVTSRAELHLVLGTP